MRVFIDLDNKKITVPKNFFATISAQNAVLEKAGALNDDTRITPRKVIQAAIDEAFKDTDKNLIVNSPKIGVRSKKED